MRELLLASHVTSQHSTWRVCICTNAALPIVVLVAGSFSYAECSNALAQGSPWAKRIWKVFRLAIDSGHSVNAELRYELQHSK